MAEQPRVLRHLIERRPELIARVRGLVPDGVAGVLLVARGSSDNAALWGRYALELATRRPVALAAPSLVTRYRAATEYAGWLAVAASQSGRTPEILAVMQAAATAGARTVAITNDGDSPLAAAADAVVALGAGAEWAVPATKTFTATVATFALVAEALGPVSWGSGDWTAVTGAVATVLSDPGPATEAANRLAGAAGVVTVGRGFGYSVAREAALKLKETSGILAEGYSAADLLHGPIAVVGPETPVLSFRLGGPADADLTSLRHAVEKRGARVIEMCPGGLPEPLLAIPAAVRAQQVALELARLRGVDPDHPFGLSKVTATT